MSNWIMFATVYLRYTVGNSLMALIISHFVGLHAACNSPIGDKNKEFNGKQGEVHKNGDNHIENNI